MSFAYGISRNYKEACDSLSSTRETIGKKYTRLAVLEKQIAAYHSVIDNYGKLIEGFCAETDETKKIAIGEEIYYKGKDRTIETDGYEFIKVSKNANLLILIRFYELDVQPYFQNKFDIEKYFKEIIEEYNNIKKELESLPTLCLEREKELTKYNDSSSLVFIDTSDEDDAEKSFEELKRYYKEKLYYNKELHLDINLPDEEGNEYAMYRNRNQIRNLIKTLCAITAVCQENQIPLDIETDWHVDEFGYCDGVEYCD